MTVRRLALSLVTLVALAAPAAAQADDASFVAVAKPGAQALAVKEAALNKALTQIGSNADATKAQVKLRSVQKAVRSLIAKLREEKPSSDDGRRAQKLFVDALQVEDAGMGQLDDALSLLERNDTKRGKALLAQAKRKLSKAQDEGVAAGKLIRGLAGGGSSTQTTQA